MQIIDGAFIVLFVAFVFLVISYLVFRTRHKDHQVQIAELNELNKTLQAKVLSLETKLNSFGQNSSKTSFVVEQIKKIESLEDELQKQKQRVEDAKKIAQKANMVKCNFLSNIGDDMRTPLHSMLDFTKLLQSAIKDKTLLLYVNNIFESGQKLLSFMDEIIALSKIESGLFSIEVKAVESRLFFQNIIDKQQHSATKKGLALQLSIDEALPNALMIDSLKVQDIVSNLVENAIKFTKKGFVNVNVVVENVNSAKNVIDLSVVIEDSGIGIKEENQEKIFEMFEKLENNESETEEIGLGLSINKKIAQLMNGAIGLKSEPGKGSVFKFSLHDVEVALMSADDEILEEDIDFSLIDVASTIVVIDETSETRGAIIDSFMESSARVLSYKTLREAMDRLKNETIDLIFIDVEILNVDEGVVSKVLARMSKAPVVGLTTTQLKNLNLCEDGVKPIAYLKKPISRLELFKVAHKALTSK
jgi:two-component system sensor histidine kinase EvgS